ncbi:MAG: isoprenylcysteine carboxylmethyltransferase family protein [Haloarculaceae archaeon]
MARPLFVTAPYVYVLVGAGLVLATREILVRRSLGAGGAVRAETNSIRVLWLATVPGTVVAVATPFTGLANAAHPAAWFWAGVATMLVGYVVRIAALLTLDETFTQHVALQADHEVIESGPYRWVRHPAYTGAVVSYVGIGLALGNWVSLLATTGSALAGYGYRAIVEERFLRAELEGYEEYLEATPYRLIPFVW